MQFERDLISRTVVPELKEYFKFYRIAVRSIDLRWGLNTIDNEENEVEIFLKDGVPAARVNGTEGAFLPVQEYLGIFRKAEKDDYVKLYPDAEGKIFAVGFGGRMLPRVK